MLFYVPQELFHRQSLCQTATERPSWPDLQHAVLQLCHEERCGTLDLCWTSSVSRPDSDLFPPPQPFPVWLHQTRIGLSLYDVAGQGYLRELVSVGPFFLSGEFYAPTAGWLLWLDCRIWRTTSWSWSPLCLSWTAWRSPSTPSTSALLFASSFSSWTRFEQVSQNLRAKCRPRDEVTIPACIIPVFVFRKD